MQMMTSKALQPQAPPVDRPLIAVVDDDASFLRSVGRLLRSAGFAVETFGSAQGFLDAQGSSLPQCLVLDVHMPDMTGLQLQERLAAQGACLPIIFVTAYDTPQTREAARKGGAFDLLLKPFDKEALLGAIRAAVGCQPCDPAPSEGQTESPPSP